MCVFQVSLQSRWTPRYLKLFFLLKYLGVRLDCELNWKTHIHKISKKLSKSCGMIFKRRHYVPKSTLKLVYYNLFHSTLQYSLLNWGRASKSHLQKLKILQNKIIRANLFCPRKYPTFLLYSRFGVMQLDDMIKIEFAKFAHSQLQYTTKGPQQFLSQIRKIGNWKKETSIYLCKCVGKYSTTISQLLFCNLKKKFKQNCIANYCKKDELFA